MARGASAWWWSGPAWSASPPRSGCRSPGTTSPSSTVAPPGGGRRTATRASSRPTRAFRSTPPGGSSTLLPCSSIPRARSRSSGPTCPGSCPGRCASSRRAGRVASARRWPPSARSSRGRRRAFFPSRDGRGSSRCSAPPAPSTSTSPRRAGVATAGTASGVAPTGSPSGSSTRARCTSWSRPSPTSCTGGSTWRTCSTFATPTRWWTGSPRRSYSGAVACSRPR